MPQITSYSTSQPVSLLAVDSGWLESSGSFWSARPPQKPLNDDDHQPQHAHSSRVDAFDDADTWQPLTPPPAISPSMPTTLTPPPSLPPSSASSPPPPAPPPPPPPSPRQSPRPAIARAETELSPSDASSLPPPPPSPFLRFKDLDAEEVPMRLLVLQGISLIMSVALGSLMIIGTASVVVAVRGG